MQEKKKGIIQREQGRIEETPRSGQNQNTLIGDREAFVSRFKGEGKQRRYQELKNFELGWTWFSKMIEFPR